MRIAVVAISALFTTLMASHSLAAGLPDTGQALCDNGSFVMVACDNTNTGDAAAMPRQDGRFGRDPAAGGNGFDYAKVCNSGELAGTGSCPADPALGSGADQWACTQDNITGLMWEVKTTDAGLRDKTWTYSWFNSDGTTNADNAGTADNGDNCLDVARCDTEKYVADVNTASLCGFNDWRMPSKRELLTITLFDSSNPAIDTTFFPNTNGSYFWSASSYSLNPSSAWGVAFVSYLDNVFTKSTNNSVRLVRGGQF